MVVGLLAITLAEPIRAQSGPGQVTEPIRTDPQNDLLDWAVGGAQILAVLAAFVGAWWVYHQVRDAREAARIERSLAYLQRYAEREFRARFAAVAGYVGVSGARQCIAHIQAWETARHAEEECLPRARAEPTAPRARNNDVLQVMDFFEELGGAYNRDLLDDDVVDRTIARIPVMFLARAWWFVVWRRQGKVMPETRLYEQLETMVRTICEHRPDLAREVMPQPAIRALVLPARRGAADEDWDRCGRLAELLSKRISRAEENGRDGRRELLEAFDSASDKARSDVAPAEEDAAEVRMIAVPAGLDDDQERRAVVAEVEKRLRGLTAEGLESVIRSLGGPAPGESSTSVWQRVLKWA